MIIKVIKNNNPRREESFFIEDVRDLEILKISLADVMKYVRTVSLEFNEYCNNQEHLGMITYANIVQYYNWSLISLALKTVDKYIWSDDAEKYFNETYCNYSSIFMNDSNRIHLFKFRIPDEIKPNKFITCLLSTLREDVYVINDKGQTIDSIRQKV